MELSHYQEDDPSRIPESWQTSCQRVLSLIKAYPKRYVERRTVGGEGEQSSFLARDRNSSLEVNVNPGEDFLYLSASGSEGSDLVAYIPQESSHLIAVQAYLHASDTFTKYNEDTPEARALRDDIIGRRLQVPVERAQQGSLFRRAVRMAGNFLQKA